MTVEQLEDLRDLLSLYAAEACHAKDLERVRYLRRVLDWQISDIEEGAYGCNWMRHVPEPLEEA